MRNGKQRTINRNRNDDDNDYNDNNEYNVDDLEYHPIDSLITDDDGEYNDNDLDNDNDDNVDDLEDHPIDSLSTGACCEGAVIVEVLVHQNLRFKWVKFRYFVF